MTFGHRRIRVACAKCGYDKERTLKAGDDRTLAQLSASLRCGGCRTWGKSGAVSVALASHSRRERGQQAAEETPATRLDSSDRNSDSGSVHKAREAGERPVRVHGVCLTCGHNEDFKPRWRRGDTLESLARDITCPQCGAEGAAANIYLRVATPKTKPPPTSRIPLDIGASILATLAWPYDILRILVVMPLAALPGASRRVIERIWEPLLFGGSVVTGIAASVGVAFIAALLLGAAFAVPARLVIGAIEYEYSDNLHNSPKGGYLERLDSQYVAANSPRDAGGDSAR